MLLLIYIYVLVSLLEVHLGPCVRRRLGVVVVLYMPRGGGRDDRTEGCDQKYRGTLETAIPTLPHEFLSACVRPCSSGSRCFVEGNSQQSR